MPAHSINEKVSSLKLQLICFNCSSVYTKRHSYFYIKEQCNFRIWSLTVCEHSTQRYLAWDPTRREWNFFSTIRAGLKYNMLFE